MYSAVRYGREHPDHAYADKWLTRPGLGSLAAEAIGDKPYFFTTKRNAERAAIAHGMSCYTIFTNIEPDIARAKTEQS